MKSLARWISSTSTCSALAILSSLPLPRASQYSSINRLLRFTTVSSLCRASSWINRLSWTVLAPMPTGSCLWIAAKTSNTSFTCTPRFEATAPGSQSRSPCWSKCSNKREAISNSEADNCRHSCQRRWSRIERGAATLEKGSHSSSSLQRSGRELSQSVFVAADFLPSPRPSQWGQTEPENTPPQRSQ